MSRFFVIVAAQLALAACGAPPTQPAAHTRLDRPGATRQDLLREWYECDRENSYPALSSIGGNIYTNMQEDQAGWFSCMFARGWRVVRY
jgi:hypothetical protein